MQTFARLALLKARVPRMAPVARRIPEPDPAIRSILHGHLQPKLVIGGVDDPAEAEADRIADKVMRMPDPAADGAGARAHKVDGATLRRQTDDDEEDLQMKPIDGLVQRKCAECEAEEEGLDTVRRTCATCRADNHKPGDTVQPLAAPSGAKAMSPHSETGIRSLGGGKPLPGSERAFFEPRFGRDLSKVRVHTGARANEAAGAINARAFALGSDIVFAGGAYRPGSIEGRRLMAHELAHVGQQEKTRTVRRYCSDPDFCTAYPTSTEADEAEEAIWDYYMIFEGAVSFGTDVRRLYESYLNRSPGDSLAPKIFQTDGAYVHDSFRDSGEIEDDMDAVLELVENRLSRGPGYPWRSGAYTVMSLTNFLSASEMENRPINFSNPFSVAGHIAGGIGSSDAGDDYRKITRANVGIDRTVLFGDTGYYTIRLIPHYEVFDAIDFCPGDCGSPLEQLITIPMSRLEASGRAYDKPFKVIFSPEPRTTRSWF